jgi:CheY-like chemotaxis protein
MIVTHVDVLWLDDEFGTDGERVLDLWRRPLTAMRDPAPVRLHTCDRIARFAECLRAGTNVSGNGTPKRYDLIILDVMLNLDDVVSFSSLDFEDEQVIRMDAGAQLAELLRSSAHDGRRAPWLQPYIAVPLVLLSSSPLVENLVMNRVGHKRMHGVEVFSKSLRLDTSETAATAPADDLNRLAAILRGIALPGAVH